MKKNFLYYTAGITITLLLVIQACVYSCPRCNQTFYDELLGPRANTLGGQELLQAIKNQSVSGQPSGFDQLTAYDTLTDNQKFETQNSQLNTEPSVTTGSPQPAIPGFTSYFSIIAQLIFFGRLVT